MFRLTRWVALMSAVLAMFLGSVEPAQAAPVVVAPALEPSSPVDEAPPVDSDQHSTGARGLNAVAIGRTTTTIDAEGRAVYRVSDGHQLDQYLFRGRLSFSFQIPDYAGPRDSAGHPLPGHPLYGTSMLLTLRAWDVDEPSGEVDRVTFNGYTGGDAPLHLTGANNQWSTDTFEVPATALRLPSVVNPSGINTVEIDVDVNNGGWAVEIDWAELRIAAMESATPVVFAHGITDQESDDPDTGMTAIETWIRFEIPELDGRTAIAPLTKNGSISENEKILHETIDELLERTGASQVNIVAHSMGGLAARAVAMDDPSSIDNVIMLGTPNGGAVAADRLCAGLENPDASALVFWLVASATGFGDCLDDTYGLHNLQTWYVQQVFNEQNPDRWSPEYWIIAGDRENDGGMGFVSQLTPDPSDGVVPVSSAHWLTEAGGGAGKHQAIDPVLDLGHNNLINSEDEVTGERPLSLLMVACRLTSDALDYCADVAKADGSDSADAILSSRSRTVPAASSIVPGTPGGSLAPGQSASFRLDVAESEAAHLTVASTGDVRFTLDVAEFAPGVGATATASFTGPAVLTVENTGSLPHDYGTVLVVDSTRNLVVAAPPVNHLGETIVITGDSTEVTAGAVVSIAVTGAHDAEDVLAEAVIETDGTWAVEIAGLPAGSYQVHASTSGPRARAASTGFLVTDGATFGAAATASTTDFDGDGLVDSYVVSVPFAEGVGSFRAAAKLVDADGELVATASWTGETDGEGIAEFAFTGDEVVGRGRPGPWRIDSTALSTADGRILDIADFTLPDPPALEDFDATFGVVDSFTDEPVDADGDGKYEALRLHVAVSPQLATTYAVNAKLVAQDGTAVGRAQTTVRLSQGADEIVLSFDGTEIGAAGKDGPYILRDFSLYPVTSPSGGVSFVDVYTTAPYRSTQFPGGGAVDQPPIADFALTVGDGYRVTFDGTASTDDAGIASYSWEFGDGGSATGAIVEHEYTEPGVYMATLTVTDTAGQSAIDTGSVDLRTPTCEGRTATIIATGAAEVSGTNGDDVIVGTSADEVIDGRDGDDVICGGGGRDTLHGSNGADRIHGGADADTIHGGDGNDVISAGAGDDVVRGANGADTIAGGEGDDRIDAGDGNDSVEADAGDDTIDGRNGDDSIDGGDGNDTIHGGEGRNAISGGDGSDVIDAGGLADTIDAGPGSDLVRSGEGPDRVFGGDGDDTLFGEGGDDILDGGPGEDVIDGGNGRNSITDA